MPLPISVDISAHDAPAAFNCGALSGQECTKDTVHSLFSSVFSENLRCNLTCGDTVMFQGPNDDGPPLVGRIVSLHRALRFPCCVHPSADEDGSVFFNVRLMLSQAIGGTHPVIDDVGVPQTVNERVTVPELIQTNLCIFISLNQVLDIAFVFHLDDCLTQKLQITGLDANGR